MNDSEDQPIIRIIQLCSHEGELWAVDRAGYVYTLDKLGKAWRLRTSRLAGAEERAK